MAQPLRLSVREARPDDATGITECMQALGYGTDAGLVTDRLAGAGPGMPDFVLVACDENCARILGVASAHVLPLFHVRGHLLRLTALAVREEAHGRGVGRALVAAVEARAWEAGCLRIEVTSGDHRPGAHAFYVAAGYAEDERRFVKHRSA